MFLLTLPLINYFMIFFLFWAKILKDEIHKKTIFENSSHIYNLLHLTDSLITLIRKYFVFLFTFFIKQ